VSHGHSYEEASCPVHCGGMCIEACARVQVQNEVLSSTVTKLEGELSNTQRTIDASKDKSVHLLESFQKLEHAQEHMEEKLGRCEMEKKALGAEITSVDKASTAIAGDCAKTDDSMISILGHQTTVEKGSSGTVKDIRKARSEV
jgi:septal ring factor EnvC (AmiA/AmiB activator)